MTPCNGKTALVTGASRGIGRAAAVALATAGAQVLVHYGRNAADARSIMGEINAAGGRLPILEEGSGVVVTSSLAAHAAVGHLSAYAATKGAVDILVKHLAFILGPGPAGERRHSRGSGDRHVEFRRDQRRSPSLRRRTLGVGDILRVDGGSKL